MRHAFKILFCLPAVVVLTFAFQNCSKGSTPDTPAPAVNNGSVDGDNPPGIGILTNTAGSAVPSISAYAVPSAIQFDRLPGGFPLSQFLYTLNVETGLVQDQAADPVYQLTFADWNQLLNILRNSVYGTEAQIFELQGKVPPPTCNAIAPPYAVILTDQQPLTLQPMCGGWDLYNVNTFLPAGMAAFLAGLETEIAALASGGNTVSITSLSVSTGPVGTQITIHGSGFTATQNMVHFGAGVTPALTSADGTSILFTIPSTFEPMCRLSIPQCAIASVLVMPGNYPVSVMNIYGQSNSLNFTVN